MLDLRFSSALRPCSCWAMPRNRAVPSSPRASSPGSEQNPSLVRKLMVPLGAGRLVASIKGRGGGVRLGRSADQITLGEIYRSSIGDKPLWAPGRRGPGSAWSPSTR